MKQVILAMMAAMAVSPALAWENEGTAQLSFLSPATGDLNLSTQVGGFKSMLINFGTGTNVNRSADLFITVKRDDEVISNVPASNTAQVKFDSFMDKVWQIVFFPDYNPMSYAGGHYEVTIPAGYFLVGEEQTPNEKVVLNYDMKVTVDPISIYPPESATMAALNDFTLTFGNAASIRLNENLEHSPEIVDMFGGTDEEGDDAGVYALEISTEGNVANFHLATPITKGSTYNFGIPSGTFTLIDADGNETLSPDLLYQYAIPKTGMGKPEISMSPVVLDIPGVIELTLHDGEELVFPNDMAQNKLYAINEDGTLGNMVASYRAAAKNSSYYKDANGNAIAGSSNKIFLINELGAATRMCPTPGQYQLVTAKALYNVTINGQLQLIDSFTYNFEVIDGDLFDMEFTPAKGDKVSKIEEIKVKFPYADEIKVEWGAATFRSSTTNYLFYPQGNIVDNTVVFKPSIPVTMYGNYRFLSDMKSVNVDGDYVGIMVDYVVGDTSGVDCVAQPIVLPANFDIYNAQGMIIKRNATIEELNALPAGIYIAGGQKILNR